MVTSSPANNIHANLIQQRFKQTIVSAKGMAEARLVREHKNSMQKNAHFRHLVKL